MDKPTGNPINRQQAAALILQASVRNNWSYPVDVTFDSDDDLNIRFASIAEMQPWAGFFGIALRPVTGHPTIPGTFQGGSKFGCWHDRYVRISAHDADRPFGEPSDLATLADELVTAVTQ